MDEGRGVLKTLRTSVILFPRQIKALEVIGRKLSPGLKPRQSDVIRSLIDMHEDAMRADGSWEEWAKDE